jgi:hypothetical protein
MLVIVRVNNAFEIMDVFIKVLQLLMSPFKFCLYIYICVQMLLVLCAFQAVKLLLIIWTFLIIAEVDFNCSSTAVACVFVIEPQVIISIYHFLLFNNDSMLVCLNISTTC